MSTRAPLDPAKIGPRAQLGLWTATSLVIGNMVGSGIFLLPASLAPYGHMALAGWLVTAAGSMIVAVVFSRLSRRIPKAGGPYVFIREGFGDFTGFFMAWGYWISILATNAAISVAFVSYLTVFWPVLRTNRVLAAGLGIGVIWTLTWINAGGVHRGGRTQLATTILKLIPLLAISIFGLAYMDWGNLMVPPSAEGHTLDTAPALMASITLTLWAFLGLESATIPAENVTEPSKTVPRATLLGTGLTAAVYIASSSAVAGILPHSALLDSTAPFADAARIMWGNWGAYLIGIGAIVSCFGAINGWILLSGQIPRAMARDGLFPAFFARAKPDGTPSTAIVVSSVLVTVLLLSNYTRGLVELYTFVILLATLTAVVPYVFASMTELMWALRQKPGQAGRPLAILLASLAFLYSMIAIIGAGEVTVYWGFVLLLAGVPIYAWMRSRSHEER